MRRHRVGRSLVATFIGLAVITAAPAAWGNEEESGEAAVLVQQAIALLANENSAEVVLERIEDAREAPMTEGVDLALVEQAAALVEPLAEQDAQELPATVEAQVRRLLEQATGTPAEAEPVGMVTGIETGTKVVLDEYRPAWGVSDGGDAVLLGLAALSIGLGLLLARRLRPQHSVRALRRSAPDKEALV